VLLWMAGGKSPRRRMQVSQPAGTISSDQLRAWNNDGWKWGNVTGTDDQHDDEPRVLLSLPAGTVIRPAECGFVLPTGRYLRIYEYGVQEEQPDGMPAGEQNHMLRPQWVAVRCRIGGNPHSLGSMTDASFMTGHDTVIVLPETLHVMHDEELIELSELIMRRIVELEMRFDLEGNGPLESEPEGAAIVHQIDLTTAGPYGRPWRAP